MEAIGAHVKRVRTFLGLTQEHLARAANVSQGAVSRLEGGRGLATPYMTVWLVQQLLCTRLRAIDTASVSLAKDIAEMLAHPSMVPDNDAPAAADQVTADPLLAEYLDAFRRVPAAARPHLLTIVGTISELVPGARSAGAAS